MYLYRLDFKASIIEYILFCKPQHILCLVMAFCQGVDPIKDTNECTYKIPSPHFSSLMTRFFVFVPHSKAYFIWCKDWIIKTKKVLMKSALFVLQIWISKLEEHNSFYHILNCAYVMRPKFSYVSSII